MKRTKPVILVVDDSPDFNGLVKTILTAENYDVIAAQTGIEGIQKALQNMPDLILLDIKIPDINGFDICKKLKSDEITKNIPVIFATVQFEISDKVKAFDLGAVDYIVKPLDPPELLSRIKTHLLTSSMQFQLKAFNKQLEKEIIERKQAEKALRENLADERTKELTKINKQLTDEIRKRERIEQALKTSEEEKSLVLNSSLDIIVHYTPDMKIIWANAEAGNSVNKTSEELKDKYCWEIWHNRKKPCFDCPVLLAIKTGKPEKSEIKSPDGKEWFIRGYPVKNNEGKVVSVVEFRQDITDEKHTEVMLQKQAQELTLQMDRLNALRTIDNTITSSLDLRLTLKIFIEQVTQLLGVDAVTVMLISPHTQLLEIIVCKGFKKGCPQFQYFHFDEIYAGKAALEHSSIFITDINKKSDGSDYLKHLISEGFVSYCAVPLISKGQVKGVLEVLKRSPLKADADWHEFLDTLATQAAIAIDNAEMFQDLQRTNQELVLAYERTLEGWIRTLDLRDHETEGHTQRVSVMAVHLAKIMGVNNNELMNIRRGALLHDIGKMAISDSILLKKGPLTSKERILIHKHPSYAYELLSASPYLKPALAIPYCHHERWNGKGYPRGLKAEEIPLSARIFAVVDVWDALRSNRPYRKAWPEKKAKKYIQDQSGKKFDPEVVKNFLLLIENEKKSVDL
ncbi:MAG: response regulator [Nitrospiraceae bacterium]|nr:response regulator [Nitrospiraceae bacterium]